MPVYRDDLDEQYSSAGLVGSQPVQRDVTEESSRRTIHAQAATSLDGNRAFLALTSPTAAQNAAQVKALTRQMNGVIRLVLGQLDATD